MAQIIKIKLKDGTLSKKWYSDIRVNGKRLHRALSEYKSEANRMLDEMQEVGRAQKHGDIVRDMSWSHFRERLLAESLAERDKNTYYANRRAFDMVDETTRLTELKQMSPDRLARLKTAWILSGKYSQSTIARSIQAILAAMRWAENLKFISIQNWRTVKSKGPAGRTDYWTRDGFLELLKKLEGDWFTAALVMGRAGLRLGEMLHLEWEDVHLNSHRIIFRSKPHIITTENPRGWRIKKDKEMKVRSIPMLTADIREHLEAIRQPSGFVLGPNVPRLEHGFGHKLSAALKATGVKTQAGKLGFPHILRHTFGSHLAQVGVPLHKIAAWMGHESLRMTERYSHLSPDDTAADILAVERLCSAFVPGGDSTQSSKALLTTLNEDLWDADSSSKLH